MASLSPEPASMMMGLKRNEVAIEIEERRNEVAIEIEERLSQTKPTQRSKWSIYRVPNLIRELNKDAYTPQMVSIGPFHYDHERLQNVQTFKWEYLNSFVKRSGTNLDDLVSFIEGLESDVRQCYAENILFDKKQLVKIILLDACFIIEFFFRDYNKEWSRNSVPSPISGEILILDLLLLENQLPFFVLERLFSWAFPFSESKELPSLLQLTFQLFSGFNIQGLNPDGVDICHFTDLLRYFYLQQPSSRQPKNIKENERLNFSATKLHEAGLKFEVNDTSQCLLGLQFSGRVLQIPKIQVEDKTEVLFRNMVAFEQCHCLYEAYMTQYAAVFDCLIDTDKDVDVLIQNGIIVNYMDDSRAVAKMFNGLFKHVWLGNSNSDYVKLCKNLNEFCRNPRQKLKATLRRDYCSTPWQTVASIAGIVLLFFGLVQTICSVIQIIQNA